LALVRDITERKQNELSLRTAEREKVVILDSLVEHVIYQDTDMNILWANQAACDSLGLSRYDVIGQHCYALWHQRTKPCDSCPVAMAMRTGQSQEMEINSPDGRIWFIRGCPVHDAQGNLIGAIETTLEITEQKQAEQQQRELQDKLDRAQRMESLGLLAGGVAHDLNNMLGPLVGYSDLLLLKLEDDNPLRRQIQRIHSSAQSAADVIQDLLTLARRGRYEMIPTDINEVVGSYLDSPGFRQLRESRPDITVDLKLDPDVGGIMGSAVHLGKAVMNLVVNACDAMPDGGTLRIETQQQRLDALPGGFAGIIDGQYIVLRVIDTGIGIPSEDLANIFEPYYSKKKMGASGSGLGLAVVYGIVKDHKGYYDIFSTVGEGTEFAIYFPVTTEKADTGEQEHQDLTGHETILVVDDVDEQRQIALDLLTNLGYTVVTVSNGHEAVAYCHEKSVDLIVMDMIMETGFDGLDTYREILTHRPGQKAVIVSGFSPTERANEMQRLGAGAYIRKPYTLKDIGLAIRTELDRTPEKTTA
jgi:PAS domain S-box-containing protein